MPQSFSPPQTTLAQPSETHYPIASWTHVRTASQSRRRRQPRHHPIRSRRRSLSPRASSFHRSPHPDHAPLLHGRSARRQPRLNLRPSRVLSPPSSRRDRRFHLGRLHAKTPICRAGHAPGISPPRILHSHHHQPHPGNPRHDCSVIAFGNTLLPQWSICFLTGDTIDLRPVRPLPFPLGADSLCKSPPAK
jgi:hypothetical protein